MTQKTKTSESVEFKFKNPFTNEEEEYEYYLDGSDIVEAMKLYADFHDVTLDGTDNHIFNLFASLDSGRYEYINDIFSKICENEFVQEHIKQKVEEKAKEEFEEEAREKFELDQED